MTETVVVRERWVGRLLYPLFGLAFAFFFVGSCLDVVVPGIVLAGGLTIACAVLGFGSWRSRLVVGAETVRLVTLRGQVASIDWSDVTRVHYTLSRVGAALALTGGADSVAVDQVHYSMRTVRRALQPGLQRHSHHIEFDDPAGVLDATVATR